MSYGLTGVAEEAKAVDPEVAAKVVVLFADDDAFCEKCAFNVSERVNDDSRIECASCGANFRVAQVSDATKAAEVFVGKCQDFEADSEEFCDLAEEIDPYQVEAMVLFEGACQYTTEDAWLDDLGLEADDVQNYGNATTYFQSVTKPGAAGTRRLLMSRSVALLVSIPEEEAAEAA